MSDNWIILIPTDPQAVPSLESRELAIKRFREITPTADEIEVKVTERVRFIDCGANFERVRCPSCGKELDMD